MRILTLLLALSLGLPAFGQNLTPGDWQSDCDQSYCAFRKNLSLGGDATFAFLEILFNRVDGASTFVLTAPLGVSLEPGVRLDVAGKNWDLPLKVCYADGCRATLDISSEDLAILLQKPTMDIRYIPFGTDVPRSATLPLDGLVAAISRAQQ